VKHVASQIFANDKPGGNVSGDKVTRRSARMVAQMLLFCYVGPYPFSVQPSVHKMVLDYLARSSGKETDSEPTAHAAMYGIGKCDSTSLKCRAKTDIFGLSSRANIRLPTSSNPSILHSPTYRGDTDLRNWMVWEARKYSPFCAPTLISRSF
jgi:hypothetical protein